jgi:hypothetical protein
MPPLRAFEIFRTLARYRVEFIVIGGYSLAAHGYIRATKDVDIFPEPSRGNRRHLMAALNAMGATVAGLEDFEANEVPVELDLDGLEGAGNWIRRTDFGRLDVMQYVRAIDSYAQLREGAFRPEIPGLDSEDTPLFCGYDDLIAMKRDAGRPQDIIDIDALEQARMKPG